VPNESSSNNLSNLNFETTIADNNNLNTKSIPPFPTKRGFKLTSLFIASLIKHIDELRILLVNYPVDILPINETKLDNSINDCEIHIPGYEILRRDRDRHGGGVCFYIRTTINFSIREDLKFKNVENLCVEIRKPQSKPFVVVN
jgi:hypothetical protein